MGISESLHRIPSTGVILIIFSLSCNLVLSFLLIDFRMHANRNTLDLICCVTQAQLCLHTLIQSISHVIADHSHLLFGVSLITVTKPTYDQSSFCP